MVTFESMTRDKERVRDTLYRDPAKLDARGDLMRRFGVNPLPFEDWELGLVDLSGVQRALDAGCGNGALLLPLARRLAPYGATVIGLDLAEGSLDETRARVRAAGLAVECMLGDIEELPFDDCSFDLVLANWVLYRTCRLRAPAFRHEGESLLARRATKSHWLPISCQSGRIVAYGTAAYAQDLQVQAASNA